MVSRAIRIAESRPVQVVGGLVFLYGVVRTALSIVLGDPITVLTLAFVATGVFLLGLSLWPDRIARLATPPRTIERPRDRSATLSQQGIEQLKRGAEQALTQQPARLTRRLEDELVAVIHRGEDVRGDEFTDSAWDEYRYWKQSAGDFLEAVLGKKSRDRLDRISGGASVMELIDKCLAALREILDNLDGSQIQVDSDGLDAAIKARRGAPTGVIQEYMEEVALIERGPELTAEPRVDPLRAELEELYREGLRVRDPIGPMAWLGIDAQAKSDWIARVGFRLEHEGRRDLVTRFEVPVPQNPVRSLLGAFALAPTRERDELDIYLARLRQIIQGLP